MKVTAAVLKTSLAQEPKWLSEQRQAAFKRFETLPMPTVKDEAWKYAPVKELSLTDFEVSIQPASCQAQCEKMPKGLVVCDIQTALKDHADKIDPILKEIKADSKFESLHQALWQGGTFIYVPPHVSVDEPIYSLVQLDSSRNTIFPFTIVVVDRGAKVVVIDEMASEAETQEQFSDGYRHFKVLEEASLQYVNIERWGKNVIHIETQVAHVAAGGSFKSVNVGLGGKLIRQTIQTSLEGRGAQAYPSGVMFGDQTQKFDVYTIQDHQAPDSESNLLFKSALKDEAQSAYQGVIHIPRESQRTNAFQSSKNLLLSNHAKARAIPKLEIVADDVRCSHSATMGTVDEEETFYLESRGLSREEAIRMVVEGFFEEVFERIPSEPIRARLRKAVREKLQGPRARGGE